jgi:hypothetical protein
MENIISNSFIYASMIKHTMAIIVCLLFQEYGLLFSETSYMSMWMFLILLLKLAED